MIDLEQVEILVMGSAVDSQRACVTRMARRVQEAQRELSDAARDLEAMEDQLQQMRMAALRRGPR